MKEIPKNLQKAFDEALDNELGQSFREMHYNLIGMSTSYKQIQGKFTEVPAIILYVHQKGILRRECDIFPDKIRKYPVDAVEARAATSYDFGVNKCQAYQEEVKLRSSIGIIEPQKTSGTLSAVVRDKNSERVGILSCEHVCKFSESSNRIVIVIYQPSHKDLDNLEHLLSSMANENKTYRGNI
ncbi:hypothetical protein RclHR1_12900005 [Rhizophagus clarus]|uniref:Uncharacterized protein n=1 Tax=Rhizophagus clarus TaxID=94130 RepID=A0A2Z6R0V7_9GLOM|nr:hypothetical protein RclHR1_12900005 [Rhizophagus clarus]GES87024.1 hypothetical protein GLOIN_2v1490821 [Rhizophagus clarus]